MSERILVLGAGGFIGSHLVPTLRRLGHEVIGYGRGSAPAWADDAPGVIWQQGDFTDHDRTAAAAEGCAVVYHLIGGTSPAVANADPLTDIAGSLTATVAFLERLRNMAIPPRRIVFVSSGGTVYGVPRAIPIPEDAPTDPISAYGINKLAVEKYLHLHHTLYGLDYAVLRVANPFGEHQISRRQQGVIAAFMHAAIVGEPLSIWGDGSVIRDYLYVEDVVEALLKAGNAPALEERVFNIASGRGHSLNEVADAVEQAAGRRLIRDYRPGRPVDVPTVILDIARARTGLGWAPHTPWEEAIARTYHWHRQTHHDGTFNAIR